MKIIIDGTWPQLCACEDDGSEELKNSYRPEWRFEVSRAEWEWVKNAQEQYSLVQDWLRTKEINKRIALGELKKCGHEADVACDCKEGE
jgi:hypothetical protein